MPVNKIPFITSDRVRKVGEEPDLLMRNRYVERNPALTDGDFSFLARPGMRFITNPGSGPIRGILSRANDSTLRVVSANSLYTVLLLTGVSSLVFSGFSGSSTNATMSYCSTGELGTIQSRDWFADNENGLFMFTFNSFASATLTASGAISDGDKISVDGVYYAFESGSVDTGGPAGTSADPWLVAIAGTVEATLANLASAINATGTPGTTYSTALTEHPTIFVLTTELTATTIKVRAKTEGNAGEGLVTTETGANLSWSGNTANGGDSEVIEIPLPSTLAARSVASMNGYVVVAAGLPQVPAGADNTAGRFYFVRPGEVLIEPLDFATAEREPDILNDVAVFNDQLYLLGEKSIELWYATGVQDAPFARMQGVVFDRGAKRGTHARVTSGITIIDHDCAVYLIGGTEKRLSTPDIEERIRKSFLSQEYDDTNYVRTWVFTLDGHEAYVVQLENETLVYDFYAEQWYCWGSDDRAKWDVQIGLNVTSQNLFRLFEAFPSLTGPNLSRTIVGDSTNGALYVLDNQYSFDDSNAGVAGQTFDRLAFAQLAFRGNGRSPCSSIELVGSQGKPWWSDNYLLDPNALNQSSWTKTNVTIGADAATAPDGTLSADDVRSSAVASASHVVYQDISLENTGASVVFSASVKADGYDFVTFQVADTAGTDAYQMRVNLATGALISSFVSGAGVLESAEVTPQGEDWYGLKLVGSLPSDSTYRCALYVFNSSAFTSYTGNGTSGVSAWGFTARESFSQRTVTLYYSDDTGNTFVNAGDLTVDPGQYNQYLNWRSLGTIREPGRLFKVRDTGALVRLDSLSIRDGNQ